MTTIVDTIVAVSTPAGPSERAIVRLSGPGALACAAARFTAGPGGNRDWVRTFRATSGALALSRSRLSVPAVCYVMRAPLSYTREDVVELHVPGSPALLDLLLDDILADGPVTVRLAAPGEFTRRAFLNGRIDLSQAEAVLAVVRAESESALAAATARLGGSVARRCRALQDAVTELRAQVEAELDFAAHGIEVLPPGAFTARCRELQDELARDAGAGRGELASDGAVHVVICGPPNAGKSSLLNRLAGARRALVHPLAGTTRDPVDAEIQRGGVFFRVTDTAGLSDGAFGPDGEAVRRAREQARSCQLLVVVLDGSAPLHPAVRAVMPVAGSVPRERVLCAINKSDLPPAFDESSVAACIAAWQVLRLSALTGAGVGRLAEALGRTVAEGRLDASAADCLLNARQRCALRQAAAELRGAEGAVRGNLGYEFAAIHLRAAADALGAVTGDVTSQDVLDRIFGQFCIGK